MPDPNKRGPSLRSRKATDSAKTPKVRKDPKFIGTQKYGREFMCKVQHNGMTNDLIGTKKYQTKADENGTYGKSAKFVGKGSYPSQSEGYKGGMSGPGKKVGIAQNLSRGVTVH